MKTIVRISIIVWVALTGNTSMAQKVTAPVMTYVPDKAGALHPILGIAGAASVGDELNLGFQIREVFIPPANDYLLARTDGSSWPVLIQFRDGKTTSQSIQQDSAPVDRVELSPSGSAAALFSEAEGRIFVFRNLSSSPAFIGAFEVGHLGKVSALGISDTGESVLVGVSDGTAGTLFLLNLGEQPRLVASTRHVSAIQFLHQSSGAVIADDVDNKVYGFLGGPIFPIATEGNGITRPIAIAVAADNSKAFVINSGSQSITKIGPYGVIAQPVRCDCRLTGLRATSTDSVFRVTDFLGGPVVLFDGNSRVPRMLLVPTGLPN
jgi:hypothetical protein